MLQPSDHLRGTVKEDRLAIGEPLPQAADHLPDSSRIIFQDRDLHRLIRSLLPSTAPGSTVSPRGLCGFWSQFLRTRRVTWHRLADFFHGVREEVSPDILVNEFSRRVRDRGFAGHD